MKQWDSATESAEKRLSSSLLFNKALPFASFIVLLFSLVHHKKDDNSYDCDRPKCREEANEN